jgi:NADPH:quinone reductase-like Zn-dependent oxidoreductase
MKVVRLVDSPRGPLLMEGNAPQPSPGRGDLLIGVHAAGVTPTELIWYSTSHTKTGEKRTAAVPGHEFSGVIAALGADVEGCEVGREVYGMNDWFADGATAEYCLAQPAAVAPKPPRLTHIEAASVPIAALTAWQGLVERARLQPGESVLIHGGAGAVGLFAVQLARLRGAHVIATASAGDAGFVAGLGAAQVIDYRASRFEDSVRQVDVVFDTVGGETLERSWKVLKPGGRMVTIAATEEAAANERVKQAFFIVEPNQKQLNEIGNLLEARSLRAVVAAVVPLSQAAQAYSGEIQKRAKGKMVVAVAEAEVQAEKQRYEMNRTAGRTTTA